jgi:hypothetical protein
MIGCTLTLDITIALEAERMMKNWQAFIIEFTSSSRIILRTEASFLASGPMLTMREAGYRRCI